MGRPDTTTPDSVTRFWDRYVANLLNRGVKEKVARWYVRRAEQYLNAFPDRKLAEHTARDVTGYLESVGRKGGLEDWQFA